MFLRIAAALIIIMFPFYVEGSLLTNNRYEINDAETDITILKSILSRHPDDLKTLKRIIHLTFSLEYFDQTEKYCDQYLAIENNSETAYLKIIAAASLGKFKSAAYQIDRFIDEYQLELSARDITLLKYRQTLYKKSIFTKGHPSGSKKTTWGGNSLIKASIPADGLFTMYNSVKRNHTVLKINNDTFIEEKSCPDYLSGLPEKSINFISLSDDGREVIVSSSSGNSSTIYIRKYLSAKSEWSSWETPSGLNPGKWNHYPNFVDNNTILFSSSDESDYDLYISQRNKKQEWSEAEKISGVNTPLDEISAWVHPDGETLYFSSNGYAGMGGFDIYGARLIRNKNGFEVSDIKNITPANTFRNEKYPLFVTPSGNYAYYNFTEGKNHNVYLCGELDYKPVPVFFYNAVIVDDSTGLPVSHAAAEYKVSDAGYKINRPVYSDGFTGTVLHRKLKYTLTLSADGYEQSSKTISFSGRG